MISIDSEGEVSIVDKTLQEQPNEDIENEKDDFFEIAAWQWIMIIFGILLVFILINASFANYKY
ncbi:MAG: hypothetical protein HeimC2_38960 [Candidatus Heimdallarchaeota archaeon LC_2]|nr:MAG: hypothetical protein HeimC2_38960 [Candidatus Heimdallarchaeota archaeon LC_2]